MFENDNQEEQDEVIKEDLDKQDYVIIKHPFFINDQSDINLKPSENKYEYKFTDTIESPFLLSNLNGNNLTVYLEIEIDEDNNGKILNNYRNIQNFAKPADFTVPMSEKANKFYANIDKILNLGNIDDLEEFAPMFEKFSNRNQFPDIPPPQIFVGGHMTSFKIEDEKPLEKNYFYCKGIQIKITDDIPTNPTKEIVNLIKEKLEPVTFDRLEEIFENIKHIKMFRYKELPTILSKNNINYDIYLIRKCIPLYYYFYLSGPFRGYWVRYNYDPRKYVENYQNQILYIKKKNIKLWVKDNSVLIKEIEKNKNWFLYDNFDIKKGFLSDAVYDFVEYLMNSDNQDVLFESEEDAGIFETFD
ncbi:hypothetical protein HERIO_1124 [Hepatospora eriocheir]|uniref:Transcription factor IIIC subunit 5 HTH domain-containing protein n=1 Tax=Hepatospora eriocheir TaxID=1081669 RepID=A0A1X0QAZ2_9MICR|nr:hypothetical protein HERIO_1124 [Hepatospora eriocheir]